MYLLYTTLVVIPLSSLCEESSVLQCKSVPFAASSFTKTFLLCSLDMNSDEILLSESFEDWFFSYFCFLFQLLQSGN